MVLRTINPIVRGWADYYRTLVSSATFAAMDDYVWKLSFKWAKHSHPNKPQRWITQRYFGRFNPTRQNQRLFGDRASGAYLRKFFMMLSGNGRATAGQCGYQHDQA